MSQKSTHWISFTAQKMKFPTEDFFSKCDQIRRKLRIWSHLLKKSLMENFFCAAISSTQNMVSLKLLTFYPKDTRVFCKNLVVILSSRHHLRRLFCKENVLRNFSFNLVISLKKYFLHSCKSFSKHLDQMSLNKKWSFPLSISSVNVTKSAVSCGFGHIYWRNP